MQRWSQGRRRWDDLYFFTEQEWREVDYTIPNFYCYNRHPLFCKVGYFTAGGGGGIRCEVEGLFWAISLGAFHLIQKGKAEDSVKTDGQLKVIM